MAALIRLRTRFELYRGRDMGRQSIKDKNFRTIGYIEDVSGGKQKALDANFRTLGYYDPRSDKTQDANFRTVAQGNVLSGLIFNQR